MFGMGGDVFGSWTEEERRAEIVKVVEGYRSGLPVSILCQVAVSISGSTEAARQHLMELMTETERQRAVDRETGRMRDLVKSILLADA